MELPVPARAVQRYTSTVSNVRLQFMLLCAAVVILIIVYGSVFWNGMGNVTPPSGYYQYRRWEEDYPQVGSMNVDRKFDLHIESGVGDNRDSSSFLSHQHRHEKSDRKNTVAIGCAVTSRNHDDLTLDNLQYRLPFLKTLLPSFCQTASNEFDYHIYVAFDVGDPNLGQTAVLNKFHSLFEDVKNSLCPHFANVSLHFVQCRHNHNPAWAQNDAMMEAYLDDMEYFYRVNDDTHMLSPQWTETLVEALHSFDPPLVGVAGPVHRGGNEVILTYDFVHRTHIDIFGYYYPRLFTDWWADDWITSVYGEERTVKVPGVRLKHTQEAGQRYQVQYDNEDLVRFQVAHDKKTLERYLISRWTEAKRNSSTSGARPKRVISMALWGDNPRYTFGTVRNAQLVPVYFPEWRLRVYVEQQRANRPSRYPATPQRILSVLERLGVELMLVDTDTVSVAPMLWRFLIADDMSVETFIVRDADARLSDRDAAVVNAWVQTGSGFHCIRDHPSHSQYSVSGGLWGARPRDLANIIPIAWKNLMMGYRGQYGGDMSFLANAVWPKVESEAYCHDSVSCRRWAGAHPFPVLRAGTEHLGQVFDAFGYARDEDMRILRDTAPVEECTSKNATYPGPGVVPLKSGGLGEEQLAKLEESMEARNKQNQIRESLKTQMKDVAPEVGSKDKDPDGPQSILVWNMDIDIEPIRDIKHVLSNVTDVKFLDKSLSPRCWVTDTCPDNVRVVTRQNIRELGDDVKKQFLEEYETDPEFSMVTHFLCTAPVATCELFMSLGKPLILYLTGRYEDGRYAVTRWRQWNTNLQTIQKDSSNVILSSNVYDSKYLEHFTGIHSKVLPPVCSYVTSSYNPSRFEYLVTAIPNPEFSDFFLYYLSKQLKGRSSRFTVARITDIYSHSNFTSWVSHPGIIHIPQQVSSYELCEQYYMNIPLFVPSPVLLTRWHLKYCLLSRMTWNDIRALKGEPRNASLPALDHQPNPNNDTDPLSLTHWLQFADFYQRPHIVTFDSVEDLAEKLSTTNLREVSGEMRQHNVDMLGIVRREWRVLFGLEV